MRKLSYLCEQLFEEMPRGVLLVNLGSPDSVEIKDIKRYLDEFLMDERVIDYPYWLRYLIVHGIILRVRPKRTSVAYQKIWWEEGSPLIVITKRLVEKLSQRVQTPVAMAMRYGKPSIAQGFEELRAKGVTEVLLVPLYPQYAMATSQTIEVLAECLVSTKFKEMTLTKFPAFFGREEYIEAVAAVAAPYLREGAFDHLLFSYHGLPERHLHKTVGTAAHKHITENELCCDAYSEEGALCYRSHCFETTRLLVERLGLKQGQYSQAFQSRLGADKWLKPFTSERVEALAKQGVKRLAVITPAFVADCVETLEEIEMGEGKAFLAHGGESFQMIPCLNDSEAWVQALQKWVEDFESIG